MWEMVRNFMVLCRGAQACVLSFSVVDRSSFLSVARWRQKVEAECGKVPMLIVMNKVDLTYRAEVTSQEVERLAAAQNLQLVRTSVKENINVSKVRE